MWWMWLVIALGAAIGELLTTGLFLASFAMASVITAVLSFVLISSSLEVVVFAVLSLVGIAIFRPVLVSALGWDASGQHLADEAIGLVVRIARFGEGVALEKSKHLTTTFGRENLAGNDLRE